MRMDEYLDTLAGQIRNGKARAQVRRELQDHLEDQAEAYQEAGEEPEAAMERAVLDMGDPVSVGTDLDRIHRPVMPWMAILAIVFLSGLGLLLQYLCLYRFVEPGGMTRFYRQCIYTLMGLMLMTGICYVDYSWMSRRAQTAATVWLIGLCALCMSGVLPKLNGSYSYMKSIQYVFIPLYGGILYRHRNGGWLGIFVWLLWLTAATFVGIFVIGGGLGITWMVALACYGMLLAAIGKGWSGVQRRRAFAVCCGVVPAAALGVMVLNMQEYQLRRLQVFLGLYADDMGASWMTSAVRNMAEHLTLWGERAETLISQQRFPAQLPDVQYDFVLLQIGSLYGLASAGLLVAAMALLYVWLFRLVMRQKNQLGQIIGGGCVLLFALELFYNVLMNLGYFLTSSGGIPFLSYGRCHTIAVYVLFGVLLSIYRYQHLVWERPVPSREESHLAAWKIGRYRIRIEREM